MYRILDTETASLSGGVVEIAWIDIDEDLNVVSRFRSFVNPEKPIEAGASAIHGILDKDVAQSPKLRDLTTYWGFEPPRLIGHNAPFDIRMVKKDLSISEHLCTLALSRIYVKGVDNHKLQTLRQHFGLPENAAHSALGDVETTLGLLKHLVQLSGVSLQTLWDRGQEPKMLAKMPFGLHKGKVFSKVPKDYRDWLLQQDDLPKDLKFTLEKLKHL